MAPDDAQRRPAPAGPPPQPRESRSEDLLGPGGRELLIRHGAQTYRLRLTQNGKLILTK
ncbi:MAG TPA: hemin uptake protein HemP [bacterium]|nr:hemin uptake protein HemP [bacterium]